MKDVLKQEYNPKKIDMESRKKSRLHFKKKNEEMTHGYSFEGDLGGQSKHNRGLQGRSVQDRSASEYISGGCEKV